MQKHQHTENDANSHLVAANGRAVLFVPLRCEICVRFFENRASRRTADLDVDIETCHTNISKCTTQSIHEPNPIQGRVT